MKLRTPLLLALLLAGPTYAAEGDYVASYSSGSYMVMEYLLCDGDYVDATPPNACATMDLHTGSVTPSLGAVVTHPQHTGLPQFVVADITLDNCDNDKNLGFLEGRSTLAGQRHQLHSTGMQLGSAVSSVTVDPLAHRFLSFEVTDEGTVPGVDSCTSFKVVIRLFYPRVP